MSTSPVYANATPACGRQFGAWSQIASRHFLGFKVRCARCGSKQLFNARPVLRPQCVSVNTTEKLLKKTGFEFQERSPTHGASVFVTTAYPDGAWIAREHDAPTPILGNYSLHREAAGFQAIFDPMRKSTAETPRVRLLVFIGGDREVSTGKPKLAPHGRCHLTSIGRLIR